MAFLDKLGDIARNIGDKATDTIEISKLGSKINSEQAAIAMCMQQIGEIYYQKYQAGDPGDPAATELFATIDGHNKAIADAQAEIERIKAENAAKAQTQVVPPTAASPIVADGTTCSACNSVNPVGTKFCAQCGNKLEVPAPVADNCLCPGCGAQIPMASKFCSECGHRFE